MSRITKRLSLLCLITLLIIIAAGSTGDLRSENVFLKDGRIVNGTIVNDAAQSITVKDAQGKRDVIRRENILRILYTKLNMGKVYIQKRDGRGVTAFMVDEDQESYTFRKEIYSPAEFTLKRSEVLFMAERNPSGLKGEPETDRVKLEWFPSYDQMNRYNIYLKKKGENFALADSSKKASFTLRGLSSNTEYIARVTGVDREDTETTPSNEYKFLTKNIPPRSPGRVMKKQNAGGAVTLSWGAATDADGKVMGYRLYSQVERKRVLVGETGKTSYAVQDAPRYKRVEVTALDDRGDESGPAGIWLVPAGMYLAFEPGIIYPLSTFGEMGGPGYGGMVSFMMRDVLVSGLTAGIEGGYFHIRGEDALETEGLKVERFRMAPFVFKIGYVLELGENLALVPALSAGGAYVDIGYVSRVQTLTIDSNGESKGVDLLALAVLSLERDTMKGIFLGARCGYGMLLEEDEHLGFLFGGIQCGMRF